MNYLLWNLFGPQTWPLWFPVLALISFTFGFAQTGRRMLAAGAAFLVLFGLSPFPVWLIGTLEDDYPVPEIEAGDAAHILVLGGGEAIPQTERAGSLEITTHGDRILRGMELARRLPSSRLWIAGYGRYDGHINEVAAVARFWSVSGIANDRIATVEDTADTCENLAGFAVHDAEGGVLLVTSAFHMRRAMACARAAGVDATPFPVDFQVGKKPGFSFDLIGNLQLIDLALHEWVGLGYYRLTGRV